MPESPTGKPRVTAGHTGRRVPELLSPAGNWDCARAAVENGADAIYFGLAKFNARIRAHNFTDADLPKLMEFLHRRGVKGFVTFNTLIFENELAEAEQHLRAIINAGADAAIIQDVGIARLIRSISPDFPIHASTQMTITSAAGVEFARELGCRLVVLARECSIKEIEAIGQGARVAGRQSGAAGIPTSNLPLEVFVHGALCVAYSGQCLTSEALGGRSANRGECAQACRMPYELISDGKPVPLGDRKYLLSPQDLAGLELLPDLARAGVASLKIEGRLKTPEYVANITRIYRRALDQLETDSRFTFHDSSSNEQREIAKREAQSATADRYAMEMAFSRGLHTGWLAGIDNQRLVHARFGKKRGVYLGAVTRVSREEVAVNLEAPLQPGDGVVFDSGKPEEVEEGGRVYEIGMPRANGRSVEIRFGQGDIDFSRVRVGDKLWKTDDPELNRRLRRSFAGESPKFQRSIDVDVYGGIGKTLLVTARDRLGHVVQVESTMALEKAGKQPLTRERICEQLGRLGGTPFKLGALKNEISDQVMLPVSELNRLRREVVAELERQRAKPKHWRLVSGGTGGTGGAPAVSGVTAGTCENRTLAPASLTRHQFSSPAGIRCKAGIDPRDAGASLSVLVRNLAQLDAALTGGVETIYCDFENPKKYRDAVMIRRASEIEARVPEDGPLPTRDSRPLNLFVAPPRIFKTGEEWTLEQVRSCDADGYLVRNFDHLKFFAGDRCVGDFSLNVANHLTADHFKNRFTLERLTASYDLNFQQLEALLAAAPPVWFEVTIHQHIPMFHMEHCVFCAFLSSGRDYRDCGRPCDVHDLKLRDRVGAEHPVKADVGCRNTVFNALAQTGAEYVERLIGLGVRHFRLEFLNETPEQVKLTIAMYRRLLAGEIRGGQLWRELKLFRQLGVTRGQMAVPG